MKILFGSLLIFFFTLTGSAQTSLDTLNQYTADLQKAPGNDSLRKKIILVAARINPLPEIPEAARENYVMAVSLRNDAQSIGDYDLPISKFKAANLLAPWWGEVYREYGITLELAEQFDEAIKNLQLYLLFNPGNEEVRKVQDEIYIIKGKKEKWAINKAKEAEEIKQNEEKKKNDLLEKYKNGKWETPAGSAIKGNAHTVIEIVNGELTSNIVFDRDYTDEAGNHKKGEVGYKGNKSNCCVEGRVFHIQDGNTVYTYTFSEDAQTLTLTGNWMQPGESVIFQRVN